MVFNKAIFHNDKGEFIKSVGFPRNTKKFFWEKKAYVVHKDATRRRLRGFLGLWDTDEYLYNIKNTHPIVLDEKPLVTLNMNGGEKEYCQVINSEELYAMLETKLAQDLNNIARRKSLKDLLTGKNLIIAGVVIVAVLFIANGGLKDLLP